MEVGELIGFEHVEAEPQQPQAAEREEEASRYDRRSPAYMAYSREAARKVTGPSRCVRPGHPTISS